MNIMVLDDEKELAEILSLYMKGQGYAVETFNDPVQALVRAESGAFDLIISDVRMPQLSGFQFARELKLRIRQMPRIIFITGFESELPPDLRNSDVIAILEKPIKFALIENLIQQHFPL